MKEAFFSHNIFYLFQPIQGVPKHTGTTKTIELDGLVENPTHCFDPM